MYSYYRQPYISFGFEIQIGAGRRASARERQKEKLNPQVCFHDSVIQGRERKFNFSRDRHENGRFGPDYG